MIPERLQTEQVNLTNHIDTEADERTTHADKRTTQHTNTCGKRTDNTSDIHARSHLCDLVVVNEADIALADLFHLERGGLGTVPGCE